jgi:hypothetical protein
MSASLAGPTRRPYSGIAISLSGTVRFEERRALRFEVNLHTELPLLERPSAAKHVGFDAVEFW